MAPIVKTLISGSRKVANNANKVLEKFIRSNKGNYRVLDLGNSNPASNPANNVLSDFLKHNKNDSTTVSLSDLLKGCK